MLCLRFVMIKAYYVVQTTSEDVVVEIYTKKDGRGNDINLHEMHLDLCRAIRKLQHDGYTIMKVYPAMGDRRESIDVLSMPEFIQSAKCPDNDVEEAVVFSHFESGATFQLPCKGSKANKNIPIAGQMTLFGDVIQEEREIPPLMSRNYMNPNTVKKKEYLLLHAFD